jgi:hypothetical protein
VTPRNVVAFGLHFHGGPLDGLETRWAEIYNGEQLRPRPRVIYAAEGADEVIAVGRKPDVSRERYEVDTPGERDLVLVCRHAP